MDTIDEGVPSEPLQCPVSFNSSNWLQLCDGCYTYIPRISKFHSKGADINRKGNQMCATVNSTLSLPRCTSDLAHWVTIFKYDPGVYIGLYYGDMSLPNMYRHAITREDRTVLFHFLTVFMFMKLDHKLCATQDEYGFHVVHSCTKIALGSMGVICEYRPHGSTTSMEGVQFAETQVLMQTQRHGWSLAVRPQGHVTHDFLLCHKEKDRLQAKVCVFFASNSKPGEQYTADDNSISVPLFVCSKSSTPISYTLVCDFVIDCPDESDEQFCKQPPCFQMFVCRNGQCVEYEDVCNRVAQCRDESDEADCFLFSFSGVFFPSLPSPVQVDFHTVSFISTPMKPNESCPETHYRCPGDFNDCLPVYTRCNHMYDCIDHQDEEGCEDMKCPGYLKCRESGICVHGDQICDGWPVCPMRDDELACDVTCPAQCLCHGHTFLCPQPFSAAAFPNIRYLDVTGSGMTPSDVHNHTFLVHLTFSQCSLSHLPIMKFSNLRSLDLSKNLLQNVYVSQFVVLQNLQVLSLSNNPITFVYMNSTDDIQQTVLRVMDLSQTLLTEFDSNVLAQFSHLQELNLTFTKIHTIGSGGFQSTPHLAKLYLDGSPVQSFTPNIFQNLNNIVSISTENYKLCCREILSELFHQVSCHAPKDEISSCNDLLQSWTYRAFLWLITCLSLTGNLLCFCIRLFAKSLTSSSGYSVFVTNLTVADFLMGVYIAIVGVADSMFRDRYLYQEDSWKTSVICKVAGVFSLLSSEVSALTILLITLDRFLVLRFPFSSLRFERTSAAVSSVLTWLIGWVLAVIPLLPMTSHWEFYSQTGICIPLPVTRKDFKGRVYSVSVLIIMNFVLFLLISSGQAFIFWSVQKNALTTSSTKVTKDITIARRLITVAVTDFLCWFPVGMFGILATAGIPIPGEVNVALAIFVLPLNSAINPFMYTLNIMAEKRRKSKEAKLLLWLQSHGNQTDD